MKIYYSKFPFWFKMMIAKILLKSLKDMPNDIVLFNELKLWIDTEGRPTTSNPNYHINKN